MSIMECELRSLLKTFRYTSSRGLGDKKLMSHHIEALTAELVPFIKLKINEGSNVLKELDYED